MRAALPLLIPIAAVVYAGCSADADDSGGARPPAADAADAPTSDAGSDALVGFDATDALDQAVPDGIPLQDVTGEKPPFDGDLGEVAMETSTDASGDATEDSPMEAPLEAALEAAPDAPVGPVSPGMYSYERIVDYDVADPQAVAWHPSGSYAIILSYEDDVFRLDAGAATMTLVGSVGASVRWRDLVFTQDGEHAVLLGNDTSANEGRLYRFDHATQSISEMTSERFAGGTYEELSYAPDGQTATLLGAKHGTGYIAYVWAFDVATGRADAKATNTSAGCQGIDWATDVFGNPAQAIVCGVNGVDLMHIDGGGNFVEHTSNAGNTSRIASRPQGDYALALCWSCNKVYRFQQGIWNTDYDSPFLPGALQVEFSTDGMRAVLLGGFGGSPPVGQVYEYRHDLMSQGEFMDVSIPNFDAGTWAADTYVDFHDASWRPGCDEGLIVGGSNTWSSTKAYVIRFSVDNGAACPG
jgi:hypothetical protein